VASPPESSRARLLRFHRMVDQPSRVTVAVERSWDSLANQLGTIAAFAEGKMLQLHQKVSASDQIGKKKVAK